ncbi:MAG TPA: helix-turn-helix domain-containing protein, partial [candidate division Zixibacteria bacterium]|nr:helix-turn-helix domain-containing protein [candidate division Zixibacteria bacterium]
MGLVEQKMGDLLKLERERRQLNLADISADIKIPLEVLEGIEKGDLSLLPTPVYYGLFTRTYSQSLGIDYTRTLEAIKEEVSIVQKRNDLPKVGVKSEVPLSTKSTRQSNLSLNTPLRKLIGAAVILIVVFLAYMAIDTLFFSDGLSRNGASEMLKGVDAERLNALAGFNWDVPGYKPPTELRIELKPKSESWATVMSDG